VSDPEHGVIPDRAGKNDRFLKDHSHALTQDVRINAGVPDVLPIDANRTRNLKSLVQVNQSIQAPQESGLAGSGRTQQSQNRSPLNTEPHPVDKFGLPVRYGEVLDFEMVIFLHGIAAGPHLRHRQASVIWCRRRPHAVSERQETIMIRTRLAPHAFCMA